MQALIELIAGFIALLAAAALSQFGVDLQTPQRVDREIHRVDCVDPPTAAVLAVAPKKAEC